LVCVDASLVAAWLLPEELSGKAIRLREELLSKGESFIAPGLLISEVTSTLRLAVYSGRVPREFGEEAFEAFKLFPVDVHDVRPLMDAAWEWARTLNTPRLYDMYYLALAEREACDLWTLDRRLIRLVAERSKRVRWVGEYETDR
jgi:predicted nucleic acid-binding protein